MAGGTLSREVNPMVYGREEFERKASTESFVSAILDKEKLFVVGSENDLEKAVGKPRRRARSSSQGRAQTASRGGRTKPR
jgi:hypothetical protein